VGKYVYHCHIVDHEDHGMMGIVNVVPEQLSPAQGRRRAALLAAKHGLAPPLHGRGDHGGDQD
jgi:hypothetical protein